LAFEEDRTSGLQLTDRRRHELLLLRQTTGSMEEILFSFSMCSITFWCVLLHFVRFRGDCVLGDLVVYWSHHSRSLLLLHV
jgi:hypothetical protein